MHSGLCMLSSTEPSSFPKIRQMPSRFSPTRVGNGCGRTFAWPLTLESGQLLGPAGIIGDRIVRHVRHGGTAGTDADRLAYAFSAFLGVFVPFEPYCPIGRFAGVVDREPRLPQGS